MLRASLYMNLLFLPLLRVLLVNVGNSVSLAAPVSYAQRSLWPSVDALEGRGCGTHITPEHRLETEEILQHHRAKRLAQRQAQLAAGVELEEREIVNGTDGLKPVSFDVYWHVVYANETMEGGYVSDDQISEQMKVLNEDFKSTNISWNFVNVTRIESPDWFINVWPGSPQEQEMKKKYHKGDSTILNIFTAQFNKTTKSLGFASLPSTYLRDPLSDGLIIRHSTLPGGKHTNYNLGKTTVHEIGHWLGLYHTFEGGCDGVGDNIDDTPPEETPSIGCPVGRKTCKGSWGEDPIHNFMDYSFDSCMTHFTPLQALRMHEVIWAFRTRRPASKLPGVKPAPDALPPSSGDPELPGNTQVNTVNNKGQAYGQGGEGHTSIQEGEEEGMAQAPIQAEG